MQEQGCAFVCVIFAMIGLVFAGYWLKTGDANCSWVISAVGVIEFLVSGIAIACRHA